MHVPLLWAQFIPICGNCLRACRYLSKVEKERTALLKRFRKQVEIFKLFGAFTAIHLGALALSIAVVHSDAEFCLLSVFDGVYTTLLFLLEMAFSFFVSRKITWSFDYYSVGKEIKYCLHLWMVSGFAVFALLTVLKTKTGFEHAATIWKSISYIRIANNLAIFHLTINQPLQVAAEIRKREVNFSVRYDPHFARRRRSSSSYNLSNISITRRFTHHSRRTPSTTTRGGRVYPMASSSVVRKCESHNDSTANRKKSAKCSSTTADRTTGQQPGGKRRVSIAVEEETRTKPVDLINEALPSIFASPTKTYEFHQHAKRMFIPEISEFLHQAHLYQYNSSWNNEGSSSTKKGGKGRDWEEEDAEELSSKYPVPTTTTALDDDEEEEETTAEEHLTIIHQQSENCCGDPQSKKAREEGAKKAKQSAILSRTDLGVFAWSCSKDGSFGSSMDSQGPTFRIFSQLVDRFIEEGSELEVNISGPMRNGVLRYRRDPDLFLSLPAAQRRAVLAPAYAEVEGLWRQNAGTALRVALHHSRRGRLASRRRTLARARSAAFARRPLVRQRLWSLLPQLRGGGKQLGVRARGWKAALSSSHSS